MKKITISICLLLIISLLSGFVMATDTLNDNISAEQMVLIEKENIEDDPQLKEIIALIDDIVFRANEMIGEEYFTSETISLENSYKVYNDLLPAMCANLSADFDFLREESGHTWYIFLECEEFYIAVSVPLGQGVNPDGGYADIVNGEREGTSEELAAIEKLKELEGHYYLSSMWKTNDIDWERLKSEAMEEGLSGNLYYSTAVVSSTAALVVNNEEVSVKYSDYDVVKGMGYSGENKFVALNEIISFQLGEDTEEVETNDGGNSLIGENVVANDGENVEVISSEPTEEVRDTFSVYFYIAIVAAIVSVMGLVILFVTKKKKA